MSRLSRYSVSGVIATLVLYLAACSGTGSLVDDGDRRSLVDLIVEADYLVTMAGDDAIARDAAVAVDEGVIVAIGSIDEIYADYRGRDSLSGSDRVVKIGRAHV